MIYSNILESEAKTLFADLEFKKRVLLKYKLFPSKNELIEELERIKAHSQRKNKINLLEKNIQKKEDILSFFVLPILAERKLQVFYRNSPEIQSDSYIKGKKLIELVIAKKISFRSLMKNKVFKFKKVIFDLNNRDKKLDLGNQQLDGQLDILKGQSIEVWYNKIIKPHNPKKGDILSGFNNEYKDEIILTTGADSKNTKYVFTVLELKRDSYLEWLDKEKLLLK